MSYPNRVKDFALNERYRRESEDYSKAMSKKADKRQLLVILLASVLLVAFVALCAAPSMHQPPAPVSLTVGSLFDQMAKLPDDAITYNAGTTVDGKAVNIVFDKKAGIITLTVLR